MIDTNGMKVIKQGVINDDFRNWMDTNFGNWEDGNLLIEVKDRRICCYDVDKKVIFIMKGFDFHPFDCKTWKLVIDDKDLYIIFSYVIYDDNFFYSDDEYHTEEIFKIIKTSSSDFESLVVLANASLF